MENLWGQGELGPKERQILKSFEGPLAKFYEEFFKRPYLPEAFAAQFMRIYLEKVLGEGIHENYGEAVAFGFGGVRGIMAYQDWLIFQESFQRVTSNQRFALELEEDEERKEVEKKREETIDMALGFMSSFLDKNYSLFHPGSKKPKNYGETTHKLLEELVIRSPEPPYKPKRYGGEYKYEE